MVVVVGTQNHQAVHSRIRKGRTMEGGHMGVLSPYNLRSIPHTAGETEGGGMLEVVHRNTVSVGGHEQTDHLQVPALKGVHARRSPVPARRPSHLGHEAETSWANNAGRVEKEKFKCHGGEQRTYICYHVYISFMYTTMYKTKIFTKDLKKR